MTDQEIAAASTPHEREMEEQYKMLQRESLKGYGLTETDLLMLQQAVSSLVERNKRLGLLPTKKEEQR